MKTNAILSGALALAAGATLCFAAAAPEALLGGVTEAVGVLEKQGLTVDPERAQRAVLEAVIRSADPLGRVMSKEEHAALQEREAGRGPCVGLRFAITNDRPRVIEVMAGSPAAQAGIKPGDTIEVIESQDTKGMHYMQVLDLLRGPEDQTVHVLVRHEDNTVAEADVARAVTQRRSVEVAEDLPMGLGYIRMNGLLMDDGAAVVVRQLKEWAEEGTYGVVLDLRGVGGLNMDAVVQIASAFAEPGAMLFTFRDREDQDLGVYRAASDQAIAMPVMVLVDEKTCGAAEVLSAVLLRSVRGAMLIGAPTKGDLGLRETIPLSSGELMYVATRRLVLADGASYAGDKGLDPDIVVVRTAAAVEEHMPATVATKPDEEEKQEIQLRERLKGDATLRRAVDVLLGLKALNIRTLGYSPNSSR
ncbi:MAG: PDZ domain-containing protein [Kiritimatiellae bacterium]|nr:PDZ domain-containing protein [Kiritimatiellia bacterium]